MNGHGEISVVKAVEGSEAVRWNGKEMDHGADEVQFCELTDSWSSFPFAHENETLPFESSINNEPLCRARDGPKPIYMHYNVRRRLQIW